MPHTDGPVYLNRTATFSIGGGDVLFKLNPITNGHGGTSVGGDDRLGWKAVETSGSSADRKQSTDGQVMIGDGNDGLNHIEVGHRPLGSECQESSGVGVVDDDGVEMEVKLSGLGSLIVFTDDAYTHYRHSIDDRVDSGVEIASDRCVNSSSTSCGTDSDIGLGGGEEVQRGYRISLTFRHKYL